MASRVRDQYRPAFMGAITIRLVDQVAWQWGGIPRSPCSDPPSIELSVASDDAPCARAREPPHSESPRIACRLSVAEIWTCSGFSVRNPAFRPIGQSPATRVFHGFLNRRSRVRVPPTAPSFAPAELRLGTPVFARSASCGSHASFRRRRKLHRNHLIPAGGSTASASRGDRTLTP